MDLEQKSIERIKMASEMSLHHYGKPLICTYSGGKDSDVMLELFKRSGVPFEVQNSHTTVDAPPTVYHIREVFRELEFSGIPCSIDYHRQPDGHFLTMWNLIPQKLMPAYAHREILLSETERRRGSESHDRHGSTMGRKHKTEK